MGKKAKVSRSISSTIVPRRSVVTMPRDVYEVGRNARCPCGSGKKYKDCHRSEGEAYLQKLARIRQKELIKKERKRLKDNGVSWVKRLFLVR